MSKRDSFPPRSASLGRVKAHNLQRPALSPSSASTTTSSEPLSAHPLLSPTPSYHGESASDTPASSTSGVASNPAPKYVPYTPRQRPSPAPQATPASAQHTPSGGASATGKLQLMNLKAAAQGMGLSMGSIGWAILEKLIGSDEKEWSEILAILTTGKATLLLPLDSVSSSSSSSSSSHNRDRANITSEYVKDHIVLCDTSALSTKTIPIVTFSGLRGILDGETLTFRSSIHPQSNTFKALLDPSTRGNALSRLPPLPILPIDLTPPLTFSSSEAGTNLSPPSPAIQPPSPSRSNSASKSKSKSSSTGSAEYPTFTLPTSGRGVLPLPPRISASTPKPPILPPRPSGLNPSSSSPTTSGTASPTATASSRISGFASLFGVRSSPATPIPHTIAPSNHNLTQVSPNGSPAPSINLPSTPPVSNAALPGSPAPSISSLDALSTNSSSGSPESTAEISAFAISRRIVRDDVASAITKGIESEIYLALSTCPALDILGKGTSKSRGKQKASVAAKVKSVSDKVLGFIREAELLPLVPRSEGGFDYKPRANPKKGLGMKLVAGRGGTGKGSQAATSSQAGGASGEGVYVIPTFDGAVEDLSEGFQDFYADLDGELRVSISPHSKLPVSPQPSRSVSSTTIGLTTEFGGSEHGHDDENDEVAESEAGEDEEDDLQKELDKTGQGLTRGMREREADESDRLVREVMEVVERAVCELFYDRLFLQATSDDPTHDEALSSRVAALNMLDLGLDHLDVVVNPSALEGVEVVVRTCGDTLMRLDLACRSPGDKAAVLVAAHKIVVDGLSKLPPVKMKPEEQKAEKIPAPEKKADILILEDGAPYVSPKMTDTAVSASPIDGHSSPRIQNEKDTSEALAPPSPTTSTPVSGDVLLPLLIYSVVKSNPSHLVSHLLYTQRFRNSSVGGEQSYCLVNLMAVADFLENVDLGALGLGDGENKVISTADLTPIPIIRTPDTPAFAGLPNLRGSVEKQVDALISANKAILGVVDTSFGMLRSFLPAGAGASTPAADPSSTTPQLDAAVSSAPWNAVRPGFGLLRRENGFSIASLAASLPGAAKAKSVLGDEESGQQLISVSRPGSIKSGLGGEDEETSTSEGQTEDSGEEEDEEDEEDGEDIGEVEPDNGASYDTRSIKSFESMMSAGARDRKEAHARKSLSDRLATMPGLSRLSQHDAHKDAPSPSRRSSLLPPLSHRVDIVPSSSSQSPVSMRLPLPNKRFVECHEGDLKVSEISELLREYKRLVESVRAAGGFDEQL